MSCVKRMHGNHLQWCFSQWYRDCYRADAECIPAAECDGKPA